VPVTGILTYEKFAADAFSFLAPMYNFYRGSARLMLTGTNGRISSGMDPCYFKNNSSASYVEDCSGISSFGSPDPVFAGVSSARNPVNSIIPTSDVISTVAFQQGTYQNSFPVSFTNVWQGSGPFDFPNLETNPATAVAFLSADGNQFGPNTTLYRSFTDEFQLSFFIACPPLFLRHNIGFIDLKR